MPPARLPEITVATMPPALVGSSQAKVEGITMQWLFHESWGHQHDQPVGWGRTGEPEA